MTEAMEVDEAPLTVNHNGIPEYEPIVVPPAPELASSFDHNGPRLMITHIVNENFKSYAGIQALGPFHKSFSSIVGPNGSGKSNVIDSMLFVFGYRANKIRSKKISVLIHSSTDHQNIDSCTVSVHFQKIIDTGPGDDDFTVVADSKFVVSRTAFKDSSSYYRVNDRKVMYKEVAALLRGCGIDLDHNRFLILQGEVEQIAMMKPKAPSEHEDGMLEFLEDIIGSSRFKVPIDQLAKRVEELNELRGEKLNRVKTVEKEKDDLEGVKNEALEYLSLENEVVRKKNMLYQKYLTDCNESEKKAAEKRDKVNEELKELNQKLSEIEGSKKLRVQESKKTFKKYEELSKECELRKEEFNKFEQQDVHLREDVKHAQAEKKKLEKSLEQEEKKLEELKVVPAKQEKESADLKKKLDKLQGEKSAEEEKLKEVMESFKTETKDLQVEKESKEQELIKLQENVNETKSKYSMAQSELDLYKSNQAKETAKWKETERNLERVSTTLKERRRTIDDLSKKIPETDRALEKAKKDLTEIETTEKKASEEVRQYRIRVEEARSNMQAARSQSSVLDSLLSLKRSGKLPGIYGRLGDLGAIDDKYDVAISTACGALDNIVVDSINTAQRCVEHLKKTGVGSATFIGLDKMDKWKQYCHKKIQTPENVPRLFDLVRVQDEAILPVFYFALRDTLVAKDLDQATRIAYGPTRFRVVTLGGQLIDTSGTMSGGGTRVCKGKMGSAVVVDVDPKDVEEWQKQLDNKTKEAVACHENRGKLEEMVDRLQKSAREMQHNHQKFTLEIKSLSEQEEMLKKLEKQQEGLVKAAAPDEKQLQNLEKKVASLKKIYDKAQEASTEVEEVVHSLHKQIMDIGGTKMQAVESRLVLINSQVDQLSKLLTKSGVAIKTAERNILKTEEKVETVKKDTIKNRENLEKLEKALAQLDVDATGVLDAYKQAQDAIKSMESSLAEVNAAVSKLEGEETLIRKDQIEIQHRYEKYDAVVKENHEKNKHWKKELDRLKLHQITDGEPEQLAVLTPEQLVSVDTENIPYQITLVEEKLAKMKPNMAAIGEYRKKEEMYLKRVAELDQVTELRNGQRKQHEDLRKQRLDEFMTSFGIITNKLKEMYQMITLGGDAELELVDSLDPFSEGIVFSVRPPKKSWKNISNLSGGEKTLSSLALVFALHHYKPTPLYVMDEIDAALDFKNVSIVANYIRERTRNAQFIIISLRNNMFELADRLIGIYKTHNCTKSVTINPHRLSLPVTTTDAEPPTQPPTLDQVPCAEG